MAEQESVYQRLPIEAAKTLYSTGLKLPVADGSFLNNYLLPRLAVKNKGAENLIVQLKRYTYTIRAGKERKCISNDGNKSRSRTLSSFERKKCALHKLPRDKLKYGLFANLHKLWLEYIEHFLELERSTKAGANQNQLHQRIAKADYHGCLLIVSHSKCPTYIGLKGIVVMETRSTFQIISPDDTTRIIPKRDNVFMFIVKSWSFTLFGNQLRVRPDDRAAKKFKSRPTVDL